MTLADTLALLAFEAALGGAVDEWRVFSAAATVAGREPYRRLAGEFLPATSRGPCQMQRDRCRGNLGLP
jgi:hypothetical protein